MKSATAIAYPGATLYFTTEIPAVLQMQVNVNPQNKNIMPLLAVQIGAVTIAAIIALIIVLLILAWKGLSWYRVIVSNPINILVTRVGTRVPVSAVLVHKPGFSYTPNNVGGNIAFTHSATIFSFAEGASPQTGTTAAGQQASVTVVAQATGDSDYTITGDNGVGDSHGTENIRVKIFAANTGFSDLFNAAASLHTDQWFRSWMGNLTGVKCDQWADWMAWWIPLHAGEEICKVEKVVFHGEWYQFRHIWIRITKCDGTVLFLDPWRKKEPPFHWTPQDYEKEFDRAPEEAWEVWRR